MDKDMEEIKYAAYRVGELLKELGFEGVVVSGTRHLEDHETDRSELSARFTIPKLDTGAMRPGLVEMTEPSGTKKMILRRPEREEFLL